MSIIGGLVSVEDGRKDGGPQDFVAIRKVRVELSFKVDDPTMEKHELEAAAKLADAKVTELLGGKVTKARTTKVENQSAPSKTDPALELASKTDPLEGSAKTSAKENPSPATAAPASTTASSDPLEIPAFLDKKQQGKAAKTADPLDAAPSATLTAPAATVAAKGEIVHADLYKAASTTSEAIQSAASVTKVIKKFTAALPVEQQNIMGVAKLPNEKRVEFLEELAALRSFGPAA